MVKRTGRRILVAPAVAALLTMAAFSEATSALDYGCGQGKLAELVLAQHPQLTYHGVDVSIWGLHNAKSVYDLFVQIEARERTMEVFEGTPYTVLSPMKVVVRQPGKPGVHLVCYAQTRPGKQREKKDLLPTIKVSDGESPLDRTEGGGSEASGG